MIKPKINIKIIVPKDEDKLIDNSTSSMEVMKYTNINERETTPDSLMALYAKL